MSRLTMSGPTMFGHNVRSHNVQSNYVRSNYVRSNYVRSNYVRSNYVRSHNVRSHYVQSHYVRAHNVRSNNVLFNNVRSNYVRSNYVQSHNVVFMFQGSIKQLLLLPGSDASYMACPSANPTLPEISHPPTSSQHLPHSKPGYSASEMNYNCLQTYVVSVGVSSNAIAQALHNFANTTIKKC